MAVVFAIVTDVQRAALTVAIVNSTLTVVAVSLRLLAQLIARKKWNMSDYLLIMAGISAVSLESISVIFVVPTGVGYDHEKAIIAKHGREPINKLYKLIVPMQIFWVFSLTGTNFSILLLYLRIFPAKAVVRIVWGTIALVGTWAIGTILATLLMTLMAVLGLGFVSSTCIMSVLRIHILFSLRFNDITFTLPHAKMFTGLEPCLSFQATVGQAPRCPVLSRGGPTAATNRLDSLTDDSHPPWLRQMEHNVYAGVASPHPYARNDLSIRSEESLGKKHAQHKSLGQNPAGGISVTQDFEVIEE
ncbi:putative integral membrane protein [Aspergillus candidus]|uniref:Rhodopsin domain-containing protein n=1 Tax=Aspergillus candidus TaxID=41067 RepID=A0A2I2FIE1_ASPCN|nr:hypothetical protein BDW47DRAFT_116130 [Aspergillus candidus]PLB40379.1 hypothetical protein BDW47DRAFT_116130 [Aspergillus candidus]